MPSDMPSRALLRSLDEALEMLQAHLGSGVNLDTPAEALPSLLEQCEEAVTTAARPQPLRTIHHFACSGGTLMAKALFALPNTVVLSEIDPLSELTLANAERAPFAPTDLILALRHSVRRVEDTTIIATFLGGLTAAKRGLEESGNRLILRDHAHSQFCRDKVDFNTRPTLHEMVAGLFDTRSVLTMRHPLDSFLSLLINNWMHFDPPTLEEYAKRYIAFLHRHAGVPVVLYEDFTVDPNAVLRRMCEHLALKFSPLATDLIGVVRLSGDSGRRDTNIGPRPRRHVPVEVEAQRRTSSSYAVLCERFGYVP